MTEATWRTRVAAPILLDNCGGEFLDLISMKRQIDADSNAILIGDSVPPLDAVTMGRAMTDTPMSQPVFSDTNGNGDDNRA